MKKEEKSGHQVKNYRSLVSGQTGNRGASKRKKKPVRNITE